MEDELTAAATRVQSYMQLQAQRVQNVTDAPAQPPDLTASSVPVNRAIQDHLKQIGNLQYTARGIFKELDLVWVIVDNALILWNFRTGSLDTYSELSQAITSVALVRPLPNVFSSEVAFLLVIATPVEILLLAILNSSSRRLEIMPTPMVIPSDNTNMVKIVGTVSGRIFMLGEDANVYELKYQRQDGWFSKKCRKVNCTQSIYSYLPSFLRIGQRSVRTDSVFDLVIDDERNILYMLLDSHIQMFDLGFRGDGLQYVTSIDMSRFNVVALVVIPVTEPDGHFMVITSSGERYYYSTTELGVVSEFARPSTFRYMSNPHNPITELGKQDIDCVLYSGGCLVMSTKPPEGRGDAYLLAISRHYKMESTRFLYHDHLSTIKVPQIIHHIIDINPPDVAGPVQFRIDDQQQKSFLALSFDDLYSLTLLRPLDHLAAILRQQLEESASGVARGTALHALKGFFEHYGVVRACAMCLALACNNPPSDPIVNAAMNAVVTYGSSSRVATRANEPNVPRGGLGHAVTHQSSTTFSPMHEAFCLQLSYILKQIWEQPVFFAWEQHDGTLIVSTILEGISTGDLTSPLKRLKELREKLPMVSGADSDMAKKEHSSFLAISRLIDRSMEAIHLLTALMKIVDPTLGVGVLAVAYNKLESCQEQLLHLTFACLVAEQNGADLMSRLLETVIDVAPDAVKQFRGCPSFFNEDDNTIAEARRLISMVALQASATPDADLANSLKFYRRVVHYRRFDIQAVAAAYYEVNAFPYVVQLALERADKMEEVLQKQQRDKALSLQQPQQQQQQRSMDGLDASEEIQRCFTLVTDTLLLLYTASGPKLSQLPTDDLLSLCNSTLQQALQSRSEPFHQHLYLWYLEQERTEELLQLQTHYIEAFLRNLSKSQVQYRDLLWRWFLGHNQFAKAAKVQYTIATQEPNLTIRDRIDMLGLASANAQAASADVRELKEALKLAHIQAECVDILSTREPRRIGDKELHDLQHSNLALSRLYHEYVLKYKLWVQAMATIACTSDPCPPKLWENTISTVHQQAKQSPNPGATFQQMMGEIIARFYQNENVFLLEHVIRLLERTSLDRSLNLPADWLISKLLQPSNPIPKDRLFDAYSSLIKNKEQDVEPRLAYSLWYLTSKWLEEARRDTVQASHLRRRRMQLQELTDSLGRVSYDGIELDQQLHNLIAAIAALRTPAA